MYQRWMALRLAVLSYLVWIAGAQTTCPPISGKPSCVCQHPDGVIDLTPLANPPTNGTPRFTGLEDPNHWFYSFNPCYKYSEQKCQNVYICQSKPNEPTEYNVATGDEQIRTNSDGKVYLFYTGDSGRTVDVYLHCDQSVTSEPTVDATGDSTGVLYYYVFDLHSCHACPGGCSGGIEAGIIGIVLIVLLIFGVAVYFIMGAIVLRVKYEATGTDLIINKAFWLDVPHLIKVMLEEEQHQLI